MMTDRQSTSVSRLRRVGTFFIRAAVGLLLASAATVAVVAAGQPLAKRVATFLCPAEVNDKGSGTDPTYGNKHWCLSYAVNLGTWGVLTRKATGMQGSDGAFSPNRGYGPSALPGLCEC